MRGQSGSQKYFYNLNLIPMDNVSNVVELGKYGVVGVMIALILLSGAAIYFLWKFACNHVEHSNDIMNKNTEMLTKLSTLIELKLK